MKKMPTQYSLLSIFILLICTSVVLGQLTGLPAPTGPALPTGLGGPSGPGLPTGPTGPPGFPGTNSSSGSNDAFSTIALTNDSYSVFTSNPVLTITVLRLGNNAGECSVNFTTADGTAVSGSDYGGGSGELVWADHDMSEQTITMQINPQMLTGTQKNFSFILYNPFHAFLGFPNIASVTIFADAIWTPPEDLTNISSSTGESDPASSTGLNTFGEEDGGGTDYAKVLGLAIGLGGGGTLVAAIGGLTYWQMRKRRLAAGNENAALPVAAA